MTNTKTTFYLVPKTIHQKSFYRKAEVELTEKGSYILYSYKVPVAVVLSDGTVRTTPVYNHYTSTTCRHMQDFIEQFAPEAMIKYVAALLSKNSKHPLTRRGVLQGFGTSADEWFVILRDY